MKTKDMVQAGIIAAIYVAVTLVFSYISYGMVQFRISEALTVLPIFTPNAILGLFAGCLISNLIGGCAFIDIVFGSLATLIAAYLTYKFKKHKIIAVFMPVIVNSLITGTVLFYEISTKTPVYTYMLWVFIGQFAVCYGLGIPLIAILEKYKNRLFK